MHLITFSIHSYITFLYVFRVEQSLLGTDTSMMSLSFATLLTFSIGRNRDTLSSSSIRMLFTSWINFKILPSVGVFQMMRRLTSSTNSSNFTGLMLSRTDCKLRWNSNNSNDNKPFSNSHSNSDHKLTID